MGANTRTLLVSHVVVFTAGFALGKMIDADELSTYRAAHESSFTRFRRKAEKIALGVVALGTVIFVARVTHRSKSEI